MFLISKRIFHPTSRIIHSFINININIGTCNRYLSSISKASPLKTITSINDLNNIDINLIYEAGTVLYNIIIIYIYIQYRIDYIMK